jgi:transposase
LLSIILLNMARGIPLSIDLKERVINDYNNGVKQSVIATKYCLNKSVVSRLIKRFRERGHLQSIKKSGRPKKTTPRLDRAILNISKNDPFLSSRRIGAQIEETMGVIVTSRTIRNRLIEAQLFGRRPAKKPLLSNKNRKARLAFAREHLNWTMNDWKKVIFSDESKFNLFNSDGMKYVRRPIGKRLNPKYTKPTVKHGGGSVMVWGCFSGFGMGPLHRIEGKMDRFMYRDIMSNIMVPYADEKMPLQHFFQQDNDPKHKSKLVCQWFTDEKIRLLPWPSQSPDLNPIENLWDHLDRSIRHKTYKNLEDLFSALKNGWAEITELQVNRLLESMPRRCQQVIKNNGYFTKY